MQPKPNISLTKEQYILWAKAEKIVAETGRDFLTVTLELMEEEVK